MSLVDARRSIEPTYHYTVSPNSDNSLHVRLDFQGTRSGKTLLQLPDDFGGQEYFYNCVKNLTSNATNCETVPKEPSHRILTHVPGQAITVQYDLKQDFFGEPNTERRYRLTYRPNYLHAIGYTLWAHPEWTNSPKAKFTVNWKGFPADWKIANSFAEGTTLQSVRTSPDAFLHSIFVGGDFRVSRILVHEKPVIIALRGKWTFTDQKFAERISKVISATRKFWNDFKTPYYFVSLIPLQESPNSSSIGGIGLTDSFAMMSTENMDVDAVTNIVSHEYFHNWNSQKMGTIRPPETDMYWFSEGFTDFFCRWIALKEGNLGLNEYLNAWNGFSKDYYLSAKRNVRSRDIEKGFWQDPNIQRQPYLRGYILASFWNDEIITHTRGKKNLGDVMHRMLAQARDGAAPLDVKAVDKAMRPLLGRSIVQEISNYISHGKDIPIPATFLSGSALTVPKDAASFDLGFDFDTLKIEKRLAKVDPNSKAFAAGLRNDQILVSRKPIWLGDPDKEVELTIQSGSGTKTIRFFPAKSTGKTYPQLKWDGAKSAKLRLRILGTGR